MTYTITVLPGDGIGIEVTEQATAVIRDIGKKCGHDFYLREALMGGCAIDKTGNPLPEETLELCKASDAVLLGAVGGPQWESLPGNLRPEAGLLAIRAGLGLYANLRPAVIYPALKNASPLRPDIISDGVDILVVRELTGGIYFGERGRKTLPDGIEAAFDTEQYSTLEVERIAKVGFEAARKRKKKLMSVDKANILESSRLWRETILKIAPHYPDVELSHMYVDNAAMQLVRNPKQFDVIVTSNIFGDILSDEASQITGSIGMLQSASLGSGTMGLYEPVHGSAPDIAGKDLANPIATILSAAMLFRYSLSLEAEAELIERAVDSVLDNGFRTPDIRSEGTKIVGTREMGRLIREAINAL